MVGRQRLRCANSKVDPSSDGFPVVPAPALYGPRVSPVDAFLDVGENRQPRLVFCLTGGKGLLQCVLRAVTDCPTGAGCSDLRRTFTGRKWFKEGVNKLPE